jgi:hypothetical protein
VGIDGQLNVVLPVGQFPRRSVSHLRESSALKESMTNGEKYHKMSKDSLGLHMAGVL